MKVYVNWDPLYENVICVHKIPDMFCDKCHEILLERIKTDGWYTPEENEFEIEENVFNELRSCKQIKEDLNIDNTISKNTLDMIDSSMKNLAKGKVSDPIDLTKYKEIIKE